MKITQTAQKNHRLWVGTTLENIGMKFHFQQQWNRTPMLIGRGRICPHKSKLNERMNEQQSANNIILWYYMTTTTTKEWWWWWWWWWWSDSKGNAHQSETLNRSVDEKQMLGKKFSNTNIIVILRWARTQTRSEHTVYVCVSKVLQVVFRYGRQGKSDGILSLLYLCMKS